MATRASCDDYIGTYRSGLIGPQDNYEETKGAKDDHAETFLIVFAQDKKTNDIILSYRVINALRSSKNRRGGYIYYG
jgi:hypothetical protein